MPYKEWSRMVDAKQVIHHLSVHESWRPQKERVRHGGQRDRVQDLLNELTLPGRVSWYFLPLLYCTGYYLIADHFW